MKHITVALTLLFLTGCVCFNPAHYEKIPVSVQTDRVINSLKELKNDIDKAGEENASVDQKLDRALTLAEKLDTLLQQLEAMFNSGKTVVKPQ